MAWVALALSACGGGGGNGDGNGAGSPTILGKWQRYTAGTPTLDMSGEAIEKAYVAAFNRTTHYAYVGGSIGDTGIEVSVEEQVHGIPDIELMFAPVMEHNGIPVFELKFQSQFTEEDEQGDPDDPFDDDAETDLIDALQYGGWLDYTVFDVNFNRGCEVGETGCSGTDPDYEYAEVFGSMSGHYSETNPTGMGSATWTGVMVGMESPEFGTPEHRALLQGRPDLFLGDARIAIQDLAAPDVDVSFTGIHNVTEGTRRPDMTWEDLSLEDGLFGGLGGDGNDYIVGMFSGPRQQEVGGEFARDGIAGAFGAKRR